MLCACCHMSVSTQVSCSGFISVSYAAGQLCGVDSYCAAERRPTFTMSSLRVMHILAGAMCRGFYLRVYGGVFHVTA